MIDLAPDFQHEFEPKPESRTPDSSLGRYFKEVAALPVLKAKEEFEMAQNIESLENALWAELLGFAQLTYGLLAAVAEKVSLPHDEVSKLKKGLTTLRRRPTLPARRRFQQSCEQVAAHVRAQDLDRELLEEMLELLEQVAREELERLGRSRVHVNVSSKAFQDYRERVRKLNHAALRARNDFVKANLRLVMTIARRFNFGQLPFQDLIQEGNLGLIKAVGRFDYRRGYRFSTYASWWIRHAITRALADKGRLVRIPVHKVSTYHKVVRISRDLSNKLGRAPTKEEICFSTDISSDEMEEILMNLPSGALSLNRVCSEEDGRSFLDFVEDANGIVPSDPVQNREVFTQVRQIFRDLKPMEADILKQRFGLNFAEEHTLTEIGQQYDLSRERIRQIQEQALGKIRMALRSRKAM